MSKKKNLAIIVLIIIAILIVLFNFQDKREGDTVDKAIKEVQTLDKDTIEKDFSDIGFTADDLVGSGQNNQASVTTTNNTQTTTDSNQNTTSGSEDLNQLIQDINDFENSNPDSDFGEGDYSF